MDMSSFRTLILVYLLGGVTFIPLSVLLVFYLLSQPETVSQERADHELVVKVDPEFEVGDLNELKGVATKKQGWIYVTRQFYPHQTDFGSQSDVSDDKESTGSTEQQITRDKLKKKDRFYAVLKHGNLFLYREFSPDAGPQQVIVLNDAFISIWPRNVSAQDDTPLSDTSLFTKKTCISIWKKNTAFMDENGRVQFRRGGPSDQFFVYLDQNTDKEDWYFALIQATKLKNGPVKTTQVEVNEALSAEYLAQTAHFKTRDMLYLIQTLNSTEGQHSSQWFNALIGRLFLSLQQTETLSNVLKEKIYKKLSKINKPGLLDDFSIESVHVGDCAPLITNPKLLDLTPEGLTRVSVDLLYTGHLHLIIATKVNLNLGSRFKKREMDIKLSITVNRVEGPILIVIKPPPTNRLWYAFQTEPLLDIDVEPVVSTRQLSNNMVTNMIKSKFKEAIKESIVMPFMDDMVFYQTTSDLYRGGIWNHTDTKSSSVNSDEDFEEIKSEGQYNSGSSVRETVEIPKSSYEAKTPTSGMESRVDYDQSLPNDEEVSHERNIDNGRSVFRGKTPDESSLSLRSRSSTDSINSTTTKKYLQTGMKKIGRWYKEQVTTVKESLNDRDDQSLSDESDHIEHQQGMATMNKMSESADVVLKEEVVLAVDSMNVGVSPKIPGRPAPEMISSRRVPKVKSSSISSVKGDTSHSHSETSSADMFVNRSRARSTSGSFNPGSPKADSYRRHDVSYSLPNSENLDAEQYPTKIPEESVSPINFNTSAKKNKRPPPPLPTR